MNMRNSKALLAGFATAVVGVVGACATAPGVQPRVLTEAQIAAIVDSPDRTAADRSNDQRCTPEQVLGFIGLRPGMVVLDVMAGGGYTTELLARAVGSNRSGGRASAAARSRAFGQALGHPVKVAETPRAKWRQSHLRLGFSEAAADAYVRMTAVSVDQGCDVVDDPVRGTTELESYLQALVDRAA